MEYLSIFSLNAGKCEPEKLRIQTLFTQCELSALAHLLTLSVPIPDEHKKLSEIFIFTLLCGSSKGFMKALNLLKHHKEV